MSPSSEIASAPVLTAEEDSGASPRLCFADKGLLKAKAQVCCCSEAFLLLLRPPLAQRRSLDRGWAQVFAFCLFGSSSPGMDPFLSPLLLKQQL